MILSLAFFSSLLPPSLFSTKGNLFSILFGTMGNNVSFTSVPPTVGELADPEMQPQEQRSVTFPEAGRAVTINNRFPEDERHPGSPFGSTKAAWVLVKEKAYAKLLGSWVDMGNGGDPEDVLRLLLGPSATVEVEQPKSATADVQWQPTSIQSAVLVATTRQGGPDFAQGTVCLERHAI